MKPIFVMLGVIVCAAWGTVSAASRGASSARDVVAAPEAAPLGSTDKQPAPQPPPPKDAGGGGGW
jgi:hypothetical protein